MWAPWERQLDAAGRAALSQLRYGLAALQKAIEIKPDFAEAYSRLGVIYYDSGRLDESAFVLKQALKIQPNFAMAHYNLGCLYIRQEKFKEAIS